MQFFFRGLLVAAITYLLKLGHNNHGLIFIVVTLGLLQAVETVSLLRAIETMGLLWAVETMGLLRAVETMGLLRAIETMGLLRVVLSMGLIWAERRQGPYMGRKLKRAGIILDGPDDATGPNSVRP